MQDWIKNNIVSIAVIAVTITGNYLVNTALYGYRLSSLEARQDRQGVSIAAIQVQVTGLSNDVSSMKATINSISDNVNYIRNRIDKVTQ